MLTNELTEAKKLAASFTRLDERVVQALNLLGLMRPDTGSSAAKVLAYVLNHDGDIAERSFHAQRKASEEHLAGKLTEEEFRDAWLDAISLDALDVVESMHDEERAELRARIVAVT